MDKQQNMSKALFPSQNPHRCIIHCCHKNYSLNLMSLWVHRLYFTVKLFQTVKHYYTTKKLNNLCFRDLLLPFIQEAHHTLLQFEHQPLIKCLPAMSAAHTPFQMSTQLEGVPGHFVVDVRVTFLPLLGAKPNKWSKAFKIDAKINKFLVIWNPGSCTLFYEAWVLSTN